MATKFATEFSKTSMATMATARSYYSTRIVPDLVWLRTSTNWYRINIVSKNLQPLILPKNCSKRYEKRHIITYNIIILRLEKFAWSANWYRINISKNLEPLIFPKNCSKRYKKHHILYNIIIPRLEKLNYILCILYKYLRNTNWYRINIRTNIKKSRASYSSKKLFNKRQETSHYNL